MTKLKRYEVIGVFVVSLLSIIFSLIFFNNPVETFILNFFMPTNNSLWEASKILFISLFLYAIFEYFVFGKKYDNFIFSKAVSLVIAPILFIFLSYAIDLVIGDVYNLVHAIVFILAIILAQAMSYYFMTQELYFRFMNAFGVLAIIALLTLFISYTMRPQLLPFFEPMDNYRDIITR